jgi:hypothetical protein
MRSLSVAATVLAALTLAACAGTPDKNRSEQEKLIDSITGRGAKMHDSDLQCPSGSTRYCSGPDSALVCGCMSSHSLRQMLGSNY